MQRQVRFLILRGGAIGDFIATLPVLQALRERWPDAHIELIGYPHMANLALAGNLVDHVDSLDRAAMARFFTSTSTFSEEQAVYIRSFDLVISFLHDPHGFVRDNLLAAGAPQVIYRSPIVPEGHAADHLLKSLETLAIYGSGSIPRLSLRPDLLARGRRWLVESGLGEAAWAIHPGSGSPKKNWPAERFGELASKMRAQPVVRPFFILGEADHAAAEILSKQWPDVPVLREHTLVEVAAVLASCRGYAGNDSGITHLAAAAGIPVVALFGAASQPEQWAPRGRAVRILGAPGGDLAKLEIETVFAAIAEAARVPSGG